MDKILPKYYKATSNLTFLKQNKSLNEDIIPVVFFILHFINIRILISVMTVRETKKSNLYLPVVVTTYDVGQKGNMLTRNFKKIRRKIIWNWW